MTRFAVRNFMLVTATMVFSTSPAIGQSFVPTETWIVGSGTYTTATKWTPNNVPGAADSILFPSGSYTVTFPVGTGSPPANIAYSVANLEAASSGTLIFAPSAASGNVTLAVSNDAIILGALTLGSSNAVNLDVGNLLSVSTSGTFTAQLGSDINADVLIMNSGTMTVNGTSGDATLTVNWLNSANTSYSNFSTVIGNSGSGGTLNFQNSSTGNRFNGDVLIGDNASGTLSISGNSNLSLNSDTTLPPPAHAVHDLFVGTQGLANVNGTLNISGGGVLTQYDGAAPSNITVGAALGATGTNGTGTISITGGSAAGTLTTGTGVLTINPTGTVTIGTLITGSGTLNANGDITINGNGNNNGIGGTLTKASGGILNWAPGRTTSLINGGVESIDANAMAYNTPVDSTYIINGFGSALKQTSIFSGAQLNIVNNSNVQVSAGGAINSQTVLNLGTSGPGTLTVDGLGSSVVASASATASNFGFGGSVAQATFSNSATGSFAAGLNLVANNANGTTALVIVESGAVLNVGNLNVDSVGAASGTTTATLNVTDQGSAVKLSPASTLTIGNASTGVATINLDDLGDLNNSAGTTTLNATGTININGGSAELGTLTNNGGKINFNSGSLSYAGSLTVGSGGLLSSNFQLNTGSQLSIGGTTTVSNGALFTVEGGTFSTNSLANSGNVTLDAGLFTLNSGLTNQSSGLLIVGQNQLGTINGTSTNAGEIQLGGAAATLTGTGTLTNTGLVHGDGIIANAVTNNSGGEIRAESGDRLKFTGINGTNLGKINLQGGTVEFTQPLTNGVSTGQIVGRGTLIVDGAGLTNQGNIAFSSGTTDVFGDVHNSTGSTTQGITISGNAAVTFWDDVTNGVSAGDSTLFKVSSGSSATFFGTYSGNGVSGTGNVYYEADISPGFSPASVNYGGNVFLDSTSRLIMQLGGTTVGSQYDKVNVAGQLALGGTLDVVLINGFTPALSNSFDLLDWGSLSGHFSSLSLPALSAGLAWDSTQLYTTGVLAVVSTNFLPGDFNRDGHVDAADILPAMKALTNPAAYELQYGVSPADLQIIGDVNGDTKFTNADLQGLLDYLKNGGGSISTVPEPASWILAFLALAMISGTRFYVRCVR